MKNLIVAATILLGLAAWFYLPPIDTTSRVDNRLLLADANAESDIKKRQELDMLVDPATGMLPAHYRSQELEYLKNFNTASKNTTDPWMQRGPWNVGGRTRAIAMDINNPDILVAAGVGGNIFKSTDQGQTWTRTLGLLDHQGIVSIAQDPRPGHQNKWYALGGELAGASQSAPGAFYFGDGVFISTDGADSWVPLTSTSGGNPGSFTNFFQTGWRIACSPRTDADVLYVCSLYGVRRSFDGGTSWEQVLGYFGGEYNFYTDIDIASDGTAYITLSAENPNYKGIYRTADDSTFVDITPTQYINEYGRIVLDVNPNNEDEVYFFVHMDEATGNPAAVPTTNYLGDTEYVALLKYTYLSGDGTGSGGQWENLSANLPTTTGGPFDKINCQGGYDMLVKVQPTTGNVYLGGTNLYFSTTGFTTDTDTRFIGGYMPLTVLPFFEIYPQHHPDQHDVLFSAADTSLVISASDGGVRSTQDVYASTVPWTNLNGGYFTAQYYTVTIDRSSIGDHTLLGGFQDNGNFITHTDDVQDPWVMPFNGDGAYNYIAHNKDFYVMSIQLGKVVKMTLDPTGNLLNFKRIDPIGPTRDDYLFINPLVVDEGNQDMLYMPAGNKLYRQNQLTSLSLDGNYDSISTGWEVLFDFDTLRSDTDSYISTLSLAHSPTDILYVGTSAGEIFKITAASTASPVIENITAGSMPTGYVISIAIDEEDPDNILMAFSNYRVRSIYYTEDAGDSWLPAGGTLESSTFGTPPSVRSVAIIDVPNSDRKKYLVGTSIGLFSADTIKAAGHTTLQTDWVREGETSIGAAVVRHITWRPTDGYTVIGTHGSGAYSAYYAGEISVRYTEPTQLQTYPNPTSAITRIDLPQGVESTALQVYDYSGRLVQNQPLVVRSRSVEVDLSAQPIGFYFIKIKSAQKDFVASIYKN